MIPTFFSLQREWKSILEAGVAGMSEETPADIFAVALARLTAGDLRNARRLTKVAADADHLPALALQATFVELRVGGKPNPRAALPWLERAAILGDAACCIRLAHWRLARRDDGRAKYWLGKARTDPRAMLLLARLSAKSRSVRATKSAKEALRLVEYRLGQFDATERKESDSLKAEFENRNPDVIWARNNRPALKASLRS